MKPLIVFVFAVGALLACACGGQKQPSGESTGQATVSATPTDLAGDIQIVQSFGGACTAGKTTKGDEHWGGWIVHSNRTDAKAWIDGDVTMLTPSGTQIRTYANAIHADLYPGDNLVMAGTGYPTVGYGEYILSPSGSEFGSLKLRITGLSWSALDQSAMNYDFTGEAATVGHLKDPETGDNLPLHVAQVRIDNKGELSMSVELVGVVFDRQTGEVIDYLSSGAVPQLAKSLQESAREFGADPSQEYGNGSANLDAGESMQLAAVSDLFAVYGGLRLDTSNCILQHDDDIGVKLWTIYVLPNGQTGQRMVEF